MFEVRVLVQEFPPNRLVLNINHVYCLLPLDLRQPVMICGQETVVKIDYASIQANFWVDGVNDTCVSCFSCGLILDYRDMKHRFLKHPTLRVSHVFEFAAANSFIEKIWTIFCSIYVVTLNLISSPLLLVLFLHNLLTFQFSPLVRDLDWNNTLPFLIYRFQFGAFYWVTETAAWLLHLWWFCCVI